MAISVTINNLKSIKSLVFNMPKPGAYVVTGANGCGKTSLLIALHRMGAQNAFQTGLPGARRSHNIDGLYDARIVYDIHGKSVEYRYNDVRWSATPKAYSKLVLQAFSAVQFLKADSSRVEPTANELKNARKVAADPALRGFLNQVFDTKKFDNLFSISLRGRNAIAHLIELPSGGKKKVYYSEKNFSLGELCVMRLGQKLLAAKSGALCIVDEFEMALHPSAQVRLFEELSRISSDRNMTILVSTHSSSLIKSVSRNKILYLENVNGEVTVHEGVYPTYALQHLAFEEESAPDKLILVEDFAAKQCVEAMWLAHIKGHADSSLPMVQVIVVGGFKEVLRFLDRAPSFLPKMTRPVAALDLDTEAVCLPPTVAGVTELTVPQTLYKKLKGSVDFLPWTPEVGICDLLAQDAAAYYAGIKAVSGVSVKLTASECVAHVGLSGKSLREQCKKTVKTVVDQISKKLSCVEERSYQYVFTHLVQVEHAKNAHPYKALAGKLFS